MVAITTMTEPEHWPVQQPTSNGKRAGIDVSVVVPVLNEEGNLERLHDQLQAVLTSLGRTYEIIFVDDGSSDGSYAVLASLAHRSENVRVVRFRRNFGQTAALTAGFDLARGAVVVTMDADLQNDPADIPNLLEKIDEGYDIASGWRVHRQDTFLTRRLPSLLANRLISTITGVRLHDYGCSLKAYRSEVVKHVKLYGEQHRFIPAIASGMGVRIAEVPVDHHPRRSGRSKYGLGRTLKVLLDLITVKFLLSYATRPIQVFGFLGAVCLGAGVALGTYLSVLRLMYGEPLADRPLLLLAVLLIVLGGQLITMGLVGELVIRVYYEARNASTYAIRDKLDGVRRDARSAELGLPDDNQPVALFTGARVAAKRDAEYRRRRRKQVRQPNGHVRKITGG